MINVRAPEALQDVLLQLRTDRKTDDQILAVQQLVSTRDSPDVRILLELGGTKPTRTSIGKEKGRVGRMGDVGNVAKEFSASQVDLVKKATLDTAGGEMMRQ
jgi:hypothetical protein